MSDAPETTSTSADPHAAQRARRDTLAAEADDLARRSARLSGLRGLLFLVALGSLGYGFFRSLPTIGWVLVALGWAVFIAVVAVHGALVTREAEVQTRLGIVDRSLARLAGKLPEALSNGPAAEPRHPYAIDLDVFGSASIFRLLDETRTAPGTTTLARWIGERASPAEIAARQEAVRELAGLPAFREDLATIGASAGTRGRSTEPLVAWAEAEPVLRDGLSRALVRAAFVLVPLTVGLFALSHGLGSALPPILRRAYLVPFVLQVVVLFVLSAKIQPVLAQASSKEAPFGRYRDLFARIEAEPLRAPRLVELRSALLGGDDGASACRELATFERVLGFVELRHSGLAHMLLNVFLLWDVFCIVALERFRLRAGRHVRGWFTALGEIEALASLGAFAYEHPTFAFPVVEEGPPCFVAERLGHPLIPARSRCDNDLAIDGPGRGMLVTGSNMSGKSTWLRSMGLAAVLAQAGAPVCARSLRMTPLSVRTSMRISDSLEQGVSHFYAELEKLKSVVDAADHGEPVFFLLDEVLHGTNSRERHIGARAVVVHLLDKGAIGAVTSHDLALADLEAQTGGRVENVHFEEHVEDGKMTFDYVLRPGVVSTTNALRLMRLVGINVALPDA
ncbi:MutS family DNA mismatch repair protein [Polyangium sp. 15x6]|uniref:MutS family DNA mismatch repair protein n=1 Tax=Polyangium sp. 15x6 TaxID=3042687 RepID=UPI00249B0E13|nr:MutS family DNA mismatch repair protein [Polyangium sp. 15x6]MDI3286462.1 DNA mismatch repair protein MutS [Polyangium sp. 15x6]